jgi:hypothetical protein
MSVGLVALGGCQLAHDLLPRTHTTAASPDGRSTAFVRQALNSDPPDDHLYLVDRGGSARRLLDLAPDADWCRTIVWTPDSRSVGFLINDQRLTIFDRETTELVAMVVLVKADGYPGTQEARQVVFSRDGTTLTFERVDRATRMLRIRAGETIVAPLASISQARPSDRPARSRGSETLRIPTVRLQLRLTTAEGRPAATPVWVKLVTPDGREVQVPAQSDRDGVVRLPACDDGPFDVVEIRREGRSTVLRNVSVGAAPVPVIVP